MKCKFTAACLAILMMATWFTVGCSMGFHAEKNTGPVTVQARLDRDKYQFLRSNGDLIVMSMDYQGTPSLEKGESFSNIVYFDQSERTRAFVKGEGYKPAPPLTKEQRESDAKAEQGFRANGMTIYCGNNGGSGSGTITYDK